MTASVNINGVWKDVTQPHVNVGGSWKVVNEAYINNGGVWQRWWPTGETPTCPPAGNYEPIRISGGGGNGGTFDLDSFAGCGIIAAAAKIGFTDILTGTDVDMNVNGSPSGTFYRVINVNPSWSNGTFFFDMGATAAAEFESGASIGYTLSGSPALTRVVTSRLRVTI